MVESPGPRRPAGCGGHNRPPQAERWRRVVCALGVVKLIVGTALLWISVGMYSSDGLNRREYELLFGLGVAVVAGGHALCSRHCFAPAGEGEQR